MCPVRSVTYVPGRSTHGQLWFPPAGVWVCKPGSFNFHVAYRYHPVSYTHLYEMVTGTPAFSGENPIATAVMQLRELPKRPREFMPALTADVEAVILKCLQMCIRDRCSPAFLTAHQRSPRGGEILSEPVLG